MHQSLDGMFRSLDTTYFYVSVYDIKWGDRIEDHDQAVTNRANKYGWMVCGVFDVPCACLRCFNDFHCVEAGSSCDVCMGPIKDLCFDEEWPDA